MTHVDNFGIKIIYASKETGQQYFQSNTPASDGQFRKDEEEEVTHQNDYFFVRNSQDGVFSIVTANGSPAPDCSLRHDELAEAGFRFRNSDWRNVEFTALVYPQTVDDLQNGFMVFETRAGFIVNPKPCCDGHAYGVRLYFADSGPNKGKVEFVKDFYFENKWIAGTTIQNVVPTFYRRWTGVKFVVYNLISPDNQTWVKLELWLSPSDNPTDLENNWTLAASIIDTGFNWGSSGGICFGTDRQAITWGSVFSKFRFNGPEVRFKNLSVREIDITAPHGGSGSPGGGVPGGGTAPAETILYQSTSWSNGISRTISDHEEVDPHDPAVQVAAGQNRSFEVTGNGNAFLSGTRSRIYIRSNNYNASMEMKFKTNSSIDNISLRLRSRHNNSNPTTNRFGGYGAALRLGSVEFAREEFHNEHTGFGTVNFSPQLNNGQEYGVRFSVKDEGSSKVNMIVEIDYLDGQGYKIVAQASDNDPENYMLNKTLYETESYAWVRTNGSSPEDLEMRDLVIKDISEVTAAPLPPGSAPPGSGTNPDPPGANTLFTDFTILYNINSDSDGCICNPAPFTPPPPGEGGGQTNAIYDVPHTGSGADDVRLGFDSGDSNQYLQHGCKILDTGSPIFNKVIKRAEVPLRKTGNPTGLISVVIRKGSDNTIATTLGTIDAASLTTTTTHYGVENLGASYATVVGDRVLIEFSGGDNDNYVQAWTVSGGLVSDTKVTKRDNTMSPGTYRDRDLEQAFRLFA